jgi:hypothetical protein
MVLPPRHIYSARVTNDCPHESKVITTFGTQQQADEGMDFIIEEKVLAAHATAVFEKKVRDMGSWTAVAPVFTIKVVSNGKEVEHTTDVQGIVPEQAFRIHHTDTSVELTAL